MTKMISSEHLYLGFQSPFICLYDCWKHKDHVYLLSILLNYLISKDKMIQIAKLGYAHGFLALFRNVLTGSTSLVCARYLTCLTEEFLALFFEITPRYQKFTVFYLTLKSPPYIIASQLALNDVDILGY